MELSFNGVTNFFDRCEVPFHPHSEVNNKDTNDPGKNKAKTIAYRYVYIIFRFSNEDEKGKETQ